ncbi:hypothetical protein GALMADRAFT_260825 [Galerina marginata CBS 339.88]|uniref:Protein kinase domain-containing protein n=1 Tax=Galerina marginata (strain CBS 339.88) TaxID=685588 RepID=A0A067TPI7_GALM3|nr:hypothetical protein GALMADRAFT_260825 [Galerina marginata CBS 339.88]
MPSRKNPKPLPEFEIGDDYQLLHALGEGAYVAAALHKPSGHQVEIKKILPFDHTLFCLRTLRELKLPKFFSDTCVNENIISILDIIKPPTIRARYFVYQTLRALKSIHSADLVHRDLKPANLLLNANCDLKICDFGLARSVKTSIPGGKDVGLMTEYVATRWYRAPEIMLSFKMYTKSIDIWAVGCILAELLSGRPLFPGRDYSHQLDLILDVIGTPSLDEFYAITSRRSRDYIRALPIRKKRPFPALALTEAIDFLSKTLEFHKDDLHKGQLKELLYAEVISFVPSI